MVTSRKFYQGGYVKATSRLLTLRKFNYSSLIKQMVEIQNEKFSWMQTSWFLDLEFKKKVCAMCAYVYGWYMCAYMFVCIPLYTDAWRLKYQRCILSSVTLIFEAEPFRSKKIRAHSAHQ